MPQGAKGRVWSREPGGIVRRLNRHKVTFPESAKHAATATSFLFNRLVPLSRRGTRVYIYHWKANAAPNKLGSALVGPTRRVRRASRVVERVLHRRAVRRAARAARHKPGQP